MPNEKIVKIVGDAKTMLDRLRDHEVAAAIWWELDAIRMGVSSVAIAPRKYGIHEVNLGGDRLAKLGIKRASENVIEVHLIKVVRRRKRES